MTKTRLSRNRISSRPRRLIVLRLKGKSGRT
jgi:hypothetical protein